MTTGHDLTPTDRGWRCRRCGLSGPLGVAAPGQCGQGRRESSSLPPPCYERPAWMVAMAAGCASIVLALYALVSTLYAGPRNADICALSGYRDVYACEIVARGAPEVAYGVAIALAPIFFVAGFIDRPARKARKAAERDRR